MWREHGFALVMNGAWAGTLLPSSTVSTYKQSEWIAHGIAHGRDRQRPLRAFKKVHYVCRAKVNVTIHILVLA